MKRAFWKRMMWLKLLKLHECMCMNLKSINSENNNVVFPSSTNKVRKMYHNNLRQV